jgi:hypothetical protein
VYQNAGRLSLLWKASDTVDVLLTAMRQENKGDNFATVALDPATANYPTALPNQAIAAAQAQLSWLPPQFKFLPTYVTATYTPAGLLTVNINYPTSSLQSVLPFLVLPGFGTVPALPPTLSAQSSMQF